MSRKLALESPATLTSLQEPVALNWSGGDWPVRRQQSLFEHVSWFYVFCREKLFRDDTERVARAVWPDSSPTPALLSPNLAAGQRRPLCSRLGRLRHLREDGATVRSMALEAEKREGACSKNRPGNEGPDP